MIETDSKNTIKDWVGEFSEEFLSGPIIKPPMQRHPVTLCKMFFWANTQIN